MSLFFKWIVSFLGIGYIPFSPGTLASVASGGIVLLLHSVFSLPSISILLFVLLFLLIAFLFSFSSKQTISDESWIVIDEVIGTLLGIYFLLLVGIDSIVSIGIFLFFFRFLDILKPGIIGTCDKKIQGMFGILLDDIVASFLAFIVTWLLIFSWNMHRIVFLSVASMVMVFGTLSILHFLLTYKKHYLLTFYIFHPNVISFIRIPLSFFGVLFLHFEYPLFGILLYIFACLTDYMDGIIARGCGLMTEFGKSFDPFSDKIVYFIPLLFFTYIGSLPWMYFIVFFLIDSIGQGSRIFLSKYRQETKANIIGKIKTTFVFLLVMTMMIQYMEQFPLPPSLFEIGMLISIFLAFLSTYLKIRPIFFQK